ncbi:ankyrin repeat domain-containing protein [Falsarthrobacter nasiphocae]|uniref:Ankyrin repeat protein n=1 Tax=Falsarthrobacter nasiphocae TaxID=189863 RepID=A0AAE3YHP5_9MICC|nr:ankyrin repeat domain-containing protein [Falsarthrobacter nasiphocae]MDR6892497.1 ankyrin repeat protein [Falsarthrobacter nasiphocae]
MTTPAHEPAPQGPGAPGPAGGEAPSEELQELAAALFDAARAGQADVLEAYVRAGAPADLANGSGDTLLMLAAYHGHADAVARLAALGADPNRVNDRGQSPLAGAVFKGEAEVIEALLAAGADPRHGTPSALDTARMFQNAELAARFQASEA